MGLGRVAGGSYSYSHAVGMGAFEYEYEYDKGFEDRVNPGETPVRIGKCLRDLPCLVHGTG